MAALLLARFGASHLGSFLLKHLHTAVNTVKDAIHYLCPLGGCPAGRYFSEEGSTTVTPLLNRIIWPALAIVALIELIFAQSQHHWILVTAALVAANTMAYIAFRATKRALEPANAPTGSRKPS